MSDRCPSSGLLRHGSRQSTGSTAGPETCDDEVRANSKANAAVGALNGVCSTLLKGQAAQEVTAEDDCGLVEAGITPNKPAVRRAEWPGR